ncbi:MAG: glycoside hydrolase family 97 N-terminal domain-containing protein [Paludibacteraceae bacterium]
MNFKTHTIFLFTVFVASYYFTQAKAVSTIYADQGKTIISKHIYGHSIEAKKLVVLTSPNGKISLEVFLDETGKSFYTVKSNKTVVVVKSSLGLQTSEDNFTENLKLITLSPVTSFTDSYSTRLKKEQIVHIKEKRAP